MSGERIKPLVENDGMGSAAKQARGCCSASRGTGVALRWSAEPQRVPSSLKQTNFFAALAILHISGQQQTNIPQGF